jgi:uncharacterized protein YbaP (TraB family)
MRLTRTITRSWTRLTLGVLALGVGLCPWLSSAPIGEEATPGAPFLWRVERPAPSYIFGTIHLPDERVLDLPEIVDDAFSASDAVYTEIPMNLASQMQASAATLLEGDETLEDLLPRALYRRAAAYVELKGRRMDLFHRFRIWSFNFNLIMLDDFPKYVASIPMDAAFYFEAEREGKEIGGLETVEEQLGVFEALTIPEQVELLRQSLDFLEELAENGDNPSERIVQVYLSGDERRLVAEMNATMEEEHPATGKFVRLLLTDRNRRMADRIVEKLRSRPGTSYFFAVGALHCAGDGGLPALLREEGLRVTRVGAGTAVTTVADP